VIDVLIAATMVRREYVCEYDTVIVEARRRQRQEARLVKDIIAWNPLHTLLKAFRFTPAVLGLKELTLKCTGSRYQAS